MMRRSRSAGRRPSRLAAGSNRLTARRRPERAAGCRGAGARAGKPRARARRRRVALRGPAQHSSSGGGARASPWPPGGADPASGSAAAARAAAGEARSEKLPLARARTGTDRRRGIFPVGPDRRDSAAHRTARPAARRGRYGWPGLRTSNCPSGAPPTAPPRPGPRPTPFVRATLPAGAKSHPHAVLLGSAHDTDSRPMIPIVGP